MIHDFWTAEKLRDPTLQRTELRMWNMDLKGAYTLLSFRPEYVCFFSMSLTDDLVYLQIAGIFGWSGTQFLLSENTQVVGQRHAEQAYLLRSKR